MGGSEPILTFKFRNLYRKMDRPLLCLTTFEYIIGWSRVALTHCHILPLFDIEMVIQSL